MKNQAINWPAVFSTGVLNYSDSHADIGAAIADGNIAWGLCMSGAKIPESLGEVMCKISAFLMISALPESFAEAADDWRDNANLTGRLHSARPERRSLCDPVEIFVRRMVLHEIQMGSRAGNSTSQSCVGVRAYPCRPIRARRVPQIHSPHSRRMQDRVGKAV